MDFFKSTEQKKEEDIGENKNLSKFLFNKRDYKGYTKADFEFFSDNYFEIGRFVKDGRDKIERPDTCARIIAPSLAMKLMHALYESFSGSKPTVISVGTGSGWYESNLEKEGFVVSAFDKEPLCRRYFNKVKQAEFPDDNEKTLPLDCSNVILFSAYPQGYLGLILDLYVKRGGNKLVVVVEVSLNTLMHAGYEPDAQYCTRDQYDETLLVKKI